MNTGISESLAGPNECPVSRDFDPFGAAFRRDPAHTMIEEAPVFFSEALGWYVVTRVEDVRAVFSNAECFSSRIFAEPITPLCPAAVETLKAHDFIPVKSLGTLDEPEHMPMRRRLAEAFKPKNIAVWEPKIREVQTQYIDRFVKRGHADLVAELFWEAPAIIALAFMGVPKEDVGEVKHFSTGLLNFIFGRPTPEEQVATCDLMGRSQQYSRRRFAEMLADPAGPGLLNDAMRVHLEDPALFDKTFVIGLGVNTLAAAHETTSGALSNGMVLLLRHLESWEEICADPGLIPGAIEECMRLGPSLTTSRRLCVRETTVGGVVIPAGAKVLLGTASGSVDPELFDDPDRFDIRRKNARNHLLFGYGNHFCLGAPLARLQMKVALEELTRRLPHMRLAPGHEIEFFTTSNARAAKAIPVCWDPTRNPDPKDRP